MILVDANLLIYAVEPRFPMHRAAREWLDDQLNDEPRVGLPWHSLLAFLRIATNPRAFENPMTIGRAWEIVEGWLALPSTWIPHPTERHQGILSRLLGRDPGLKGNLVPDAHLAALSMSYGLILCSTDRDFARFPGLQWKNPLSELEH